jgi:simple sugar transport system ATP-binding protein
MNVAPANPIFGLYRIAKRFGGFQALANFDFELYPNEVVALLGDNGAGKSTLIKIMSGIVRADEGEARSDGKVQILRSRRDSEQLGIETIYQDTALVDSMSITRNIFMGREISGRFGLMNLKAMRETAIDVLSQVVHIGGVDDPDKIVGALSGGQKQAVAIARALYFKRRILLLDEPTSALSVRETEALLAYIRQIRDEGVSSVLVTHNLYHAYQACDRFVVLSHGRKVYESPKSLTSIEELTSRVILA